MGSKTQTLLERAAADENTSSVAFAEREFSEQENSAAVFALLQTKMLNIDDWNRNSSLSTFCLFDKNGAAITGRLIETNLFNRLHLKNSGKYDWVKFTDIYRAADEMIITIQPTYDPTVEQPAPNTTSHFFTAESTNNFCLCRDENVLRFYVIGLNEKQNTRETNGAVESLRNLVTANVAYYSGTQKKQWQTFCRNFLNSAG